MPEVGSFDPEDAKVLFDQLWDPHQPSGSDAVAAAVDVDNLLTDFAGVVSGDKVQSRWLKLLRQYSLAV